MDGEQPIDPDATAQDPNVPIEEVEPVIPEKKSNIPEETLQDVKNLWRVFDMKKTDKVDIKELKRIMGALDFHLEPKELALVRK